MAKIAVELEQAVVKRAVAGAPGEAVGRVLALGNGWSVADVLCTSGPQDRPFEEQHSQVSIAVVVAGSFQYRSSGGRAVMTPGSVLLGGAGNYFECGHEHASGDRCLAFRYSPEYCEALAADAGARKIKPRFRTPRLPPVRPLSPLIARAFAQLSVPPSTAWEELSIELAVRAVQLSEGLPSLASGAPPGAEARVTSIVRMIERHPDAALSVSDLAREARLSPYHFLRTFERIAGVTPHQYVLRTRLREAAIRLAGGQQGILDISLDSGFGDLSNFNRAFRAEFGVSPRAYRAKLGIESS